jgi:hypothetical protein
MSNDESQANHLHIPVSDPKRRKLIETLLQAATALAMNLAGDDGDGSVFHTELGEAFLRDEAAVNFGICWSPLEVLLNSKLHEKGKEPQTLLDIQLKAIREPLNG